MDSYTLASFGWKVPSNKDNILTTANTSAGSFEQTQGAVGWKNDPRLRGYSKIEELPDSLRSQLGVLLVGLLQSSCCLLRNILLTPARNLNDLRARLVLAETSLTNWKQEIDSSLNFERVVFLHEPKSEQTDMWKLLDELSLVGKMVSRREGDHVSDLKPQGFLNHLDQRHERQNVPAEDMLDAYDVKTLDLRASEHFKPTDYPDSNLFKSSDDDHDFVETIAIKPVEKEVQEHFVRGPTFLQRVEPYKHSRWSELGLPAELLNEDYLTAFTSSNPFIGSFSKGVCGTGIAAFYKNCAFADGTSPHLLDIRSSANVRMKLGLLLAVPNNPMLLMISDQDVFIYSVTSDLRSQLFQSVKLSSPLVSKKYCCTVDADDSTTAILLHIDGACTLLHKGIPQGTFRGFLPPALLPYIQSNEERAILSNSQIPRLYMINVRRDRQLAIAYTLIPADPYRPQPKRAIVSLLNFPTASSPSEFSGRPNPSPLLLQLEIVWPSNEELIGVALSSDAHHILECVRQQEGGVSVRVQKLEKDKLSKCGEQVILDRSVLMHQYPRTIQSSHQTCLTFCRNCEWCRSASVLSFSKLSQDAYALSSLFVGLHILRFVSTTKSVQKVAHYDFDQTNLPVSVLACSEEEVLFVQPQSNSQKTRVWSLKVSW